MQLKQLLEIQNELNQHCPRYPEGDEITWAIAENRLNQIQLKIA